MPNKFRVYTRGLKEKLIRFDYDTLEKAQMDIRICRDHGQAAMVIVNGDKN